MKKLSITTLIALSLSTLYANDQVHFVEPVQEAIPYSTNGIYDIKNGNVSGSFSTQGRYIDANSNNKMFATYGNLKYETSSEDMFQTVFNFYGITGWGAIKNSDRISSYVKPDGSGYSILNEAFVKAHLKHSMGESCVKVGRFHANEKLINSQENTRYDYPVPNSFEGAGIGTMFSNGLSVKAAWINRMAGADNGLSVSEFKNIEDIAKGYNPGINDDSDGAFFGKIAYNYNNVATINVQDLYVDNYTNTFLGEAKIKVSDIAKMDMPLSSGFQYMKYSSEDDSIDSDVYGLNFGFKPSEKITGFIAYNNIGDTGIPGFAYGADPLYTSMQIMTAYGDSNVDAVKVSGKYNVSDTYNLELGYGYFNGDNLDVNAFEVTSNYNVTKDIKIRSVLGYLDSDQDNQFVGKALLSYSF